MNVFRLLILIPLFIITACVPEAYIIDQESKPTEKELTPYDLASNFNIGGNGYKGCYVDPLSRGFSESTVFSFSQEGDDYFLDFSNLGWTNGSCSFSGQLPTTIKAEYYKIIKSEFIEKVGDKDHVRLTLRVMAYDDELAAWVDGSVADEVKEVLNDPNSFSFLIPEKYDNKFEIEMFLEVR